MILKNIDVPQNQIIISCSIFKYELEYLKSKGEIDIPVVYLNSMLHMNPQELNLYLDAMIEKYNDFSIILLFGDCHARMVDYEKNRNIVRSPGINCCEIIIGSEEYRKLRRDGAFILLPEWADRWREVFVDYMGFKTSKAANLFMSEMHKKLVYIDTGYHERDNALLKEISDYVGLPIEVYKSSIVKLETSIKHLITNSRIQE